MKNYEIAIESFTKKILNDIATLMKNHNVECVDLSEYIGCLENGCFVLRHKFGGQHIDDIDLYRAQHLYENVYREIFKDYYEVIKQDNIVSEGNTSLTDSTEKTFYVRYGVRVYMIINDARNCDGQGIIKVACYSPLVLSKFGLNDGRLKNLKVGEMIEALDMEGVSVMRLM